MSYKIALCDDQEGILFLLQKYLVEISQNESIPIKIHSYQNPVVLLDKVKENPVYYDIFLLDIDMPKMNGIKLGERIRSENKNCIIIYITAHNQYAYNAYQVRAFHYLMKPIQKEKIKILLKEAITYIQQKKDQENQGKLTINHNGEYVQIKYDEIIYFEKSKNMVNVICINEIYSYYISIKKLMNELNNADNFVQSHQGYVINANKIISYKNRVVTLEHGYEVPVTRRNNKIFKQLFFESLRR